MSVLEKEMATHSSVLAWRIPGTEEPGGLPSMGSHRVGHDWSNLAAAAAEYCVNIHNKMNKIKNLKMAGYGKDVEQWKFLYIVESESEVTQ